MADTKTLIEQAYAAFNKRDIDGALALMTQDVSWPKASEGGKVIGKEEMRAYWTRQWVANACRSGSRRILEFCRTNAGHTDLGRRYRSATRLARVGSARRE